MTLQADLFMLHAHQCLDHVAHPAGLNVCGSCTAFQDKHSHAHCYCRAGTLKHTLWRSQRVEGYALASPFMVQHARGMSHAHRGNSLDIALQAPLYPDKAVLFPDSAFVLGYDTAIRLLMPKYYGGNDEMLVQLASMSYKGCSILAVGRIVEDDDGNNSFKSFEDVAVPEALEKLVRGKCSCNRSKIAEYCCL